MSFIKKFIKPALRKLPTIGQYVDYVPYFVKTLSFLGDIPEKVKSVPVIGDLANKYLTETGISKGLKKAAHWLSEAGFGGTEEELANEKITEIKKESKENEKKMKDIYENRIKQLEEQRQWKPLAGKDELAMDIGIVNAEKYRNLFSPINTPNTAVPQNPPIVPIKEKAPAISILGRNVEEMRRKNPIQYETRRAFPGDFLVPTQRMLPMRESTYSDAINAADVLRDMGMAGRKRRAMQYIQNPPYKRPKIERDRTTISTRLFS